MGSISTHYEITREVIKVMKSILPNQDYHFLELGNFLTDVSQFRDPLSFVKAKHRIYDSQTWYLRRNITGIHLNILAPYLNRLFGVQYPLFKDGIISQYFSNLIMGLTLQIASLANHDSVEVERIFNERFTFYYPHEHLDFPPLNNISLIGRPGLYTIPNGDIMNYLKEYVWNISVELTKIENQWKSLHRGSNNQEGHDILAAFGNILHPVEDFFFHSNFVENLFYQKKNVGNPLGVPGFGLYRAPRRLGSAVERDTYNFLFEFFNQSLPISNSFQRRMNSSKRRFFRRLRFPYGRNFRIQPLESASALDFVYTGGFGENDIYHTLYDALSSIEKRFELPFTDANGNDMSLTPPWENCGLVLLENIFSEEKRELIRTDDVYLTQIVEQHKRQLENNRYQILISRNNSLTPAVKAKWIEAYDLDKDLSNSSFGLTPGLGGFIFELIKEMQTESHRSSSASARNRRIIDFRTNNGSSKEEIGNHSLMSKDTSNSDPFREESVRLAKMTSTCISYIMANEMSTNSYRNRRVAWHQVLQQFLKFPTYNANRTWESIAFDNMHSSYQDIINRIQITHHNLSSRSYIRALESNKRNELEQRHLDKIHTWNQNWILKTTAIRRA